MLSHYYRLLQEDAAEFLQKVAFDPDTAPRLSSSFGFAVTETYECCACRSHAARITDVHHTLMLPVTTRGNPSLPFGDVLQALNYRFQVEERVQWAETCAHCAHQDNIFLRTETFHSTPDVLCVVLMRWTQLAGTLAMHAHRVDPTGDLLLRDQVYCFKSAVVHLGASPDSGDYIAVAKHGDHWHLYDDVVRSRALDAQISTSTMYNGLPMKTYILFYERQ